MIAVLGSCGSPTTRSDPAPPPEATAEFSCGEVVLAQGEVLEVAGSMQRTCLESALRDGRSATLTVTAPTVEGDPVTTAWVVTADGTLSADSDTSRDRFADPSGDYRVTCGRVTTLPRPLECPARE